MEAGLHFNVAVDEIIVGMSGMSEYYFYVRIVHMSNVDRCKNQAKLYVRKSATSPPICPFYRLNLFVLIANPTSCYSTHFPPNPNVGYR